MKGLSKRYMISLDQIYKYLLLPLCVLFSDDGSDCLIKSENCGLLGAERASWSTRPAPVAARGM